MDIEYILFGFHELCLCTFKEKMISEEELYLEKNIHDPWSQNRGLQYIRRRNYIQQLKEVFGDRVFDTAVDMACGTAYLSIELSVFSKSLLLCDYSEHVLELAKKVTDNRFLYKQNILPKVNIEPSFDIIYAIEVLYYLDSNELAEFFVNVKRIIYPDSYLVITINKKALDDIEHGFNIEKVYYRYVSFLNMPDVFYQMEIFFNILSGRINVKDKYTKRKTLNKASMISHYRYLLFPLLIFYPLKYLCPFLYESRLLATLFYNIGKMFNKKHERQLIIMKLK